MLLKTFPLPSHDTPQQQVQKLSADLDSLRKELLDLKSSVSTTTASQASIQSELSLVAEEIAALHNQPAHSSKDVTAAGSGPAVSLVEPRATGVVLETVVVKATSPPPPPATAVKKQGPTLWKPPVYLISDLLKYEPVTADDPAPPEHTTWIPKMGVRSYAKDTPEYTGASNRTGIIYITSIKRWDKLSRPKKEEFAATFRGWWEHDGDARLLIFGKHPGKEMFKYFDARKVLVVRRFKHVTGYARINDMIPRSISAIPHCPAFVLLNSDVFFKTKSLLPTIQAALGVFKEGFMIVGRRYNTDDKVRMVNRTYYGFKVEDSHIRASIGAPNFIDYFIFTPNFFNYTSWREMPDYVMGGTQWDNWLTHFSIRRSGKPVIDASKTVIALHLNHGVSSQKGKASTFNIKVTLDKKVYKSIVRGTIDRALYESYYDTKGNVRIR